jgi:hypothetical protein
MKEVKLTVIINRAAHEVFDFTLNPENTPKWIDGVVTEQSNESPAKLGTIYKNRDRDGNWNEYKITDYEPGIMFIMSKKDGNYHVKYTLKPLDDNQCELEYYEWVDDGILEGPFTQDIIEKLKDIIEKPKRYLITLKSGQKHITDYFDDDEAVWRWVDTGVAGIVYGNENIGLSPDDIANIQRVEDN